MKLIIVNLFCTMVLCLCVMDFTGAQENAAAGNSFKSVDLPENNNLAAAPKDQSLSGLLKEKLSRSHKCSKCGHVDRESDSLFWLMIGFIGQLVFTGRFLVQWIKSERRKQSYIPHIFWHLSIAGSLLLLLYAISITAWPIILGQAFGIIVYGRNLALIARGKNAEALKQASAPSDKSVTISPDSTQDGDNLRN